MYSCPEFLTNKRGFVSLNSLRLVYIFLFYCVWNVVRAYFRKLWSAFIITCVHNLNFLSTPLYIRTPKCSRFELIFLSPTEAWTTVLLIYPSLSSYFFSFLKSELSVRLTLLFATFVKSSTFLCLPKAKLCLPTLVQVNLAYPSLSYAWHTKSG